jgi:hypothetical protein
MQIWAILQIDGPRHSHLLRNQFLYLPEHAIPLSDDGQRPSRTQLVWHKSVAQCVCDHYKSLPKIATTLKHFGNLKKD